MKKFLLFIGSLLCMTTILYGQTLHVSSFLGYPLTVGDVMLSDGSIWHANQLISDNIIVTGIKETVKQDILIYPNPVRDYFKIESEETIKIVEIIDSSGRILLRQQVNTGKIEISFENYSSGNYLLYITTNNEKITRKIIKL